MAFRKVGDHAVVIITHEGMMQSDLSGYRGWTLIIDELPPAWQHKRYAVPASNDWFAAHYKITTPHKSTTWHRVIPMAMSLVDTNDILGDDFLGPAGAFGKAVVNRKHGVYVDCADFNKVTAFEWYAIWEPDTLRPFAAVYLLGNAVEQSLLFKLWSREFPTQVTFMPFQITSQPYMPRDVLIRYFSVRPASAAYINGEDDPLTPICAWLARNVTASTTAMDASGTTTTEHHHIYTFNRSQLHRVLPGERLSPKKSGSNEYRAFHEATMLYAARPKLPCHLANVGLTRPTESRP